MEKIVSIGKQTWRHWREMTFIYSIQLLLGFAVGLTFCSALCGSLDGSMALDQLAKGFDRTVIMDVLNSDSGALDNTKAVALTLLGAYLLMSVFLHAGWLVNINTKSYSIKSFLKNGMKYFMPFLGIALISLLVFISFVASIGFGFAKTIGDPLVAFSSEKPFVIWLIVLLVIFFIWTILVWSWSVASRFHYIKSEPFFGSLKLGLKSVINKLIKFLGIGLMILGIQVVLMFLYYCIMGDKGAPSWSVVIFGVFVQQVFHFMRVILRGFGYTLVDDLTQ